MQQKMAAGESPAAEMIKSVSLIIAGLPSSVAGIFHRFSRPSLKHAGAKTFDAEGAAAFTFFPDAGRRAKRRYWRWKHLTASDSVKMTTATAY